MENHKLILEVNNLSIALKNKVTSMLVKDVSFNLYQGRTLALVGESGSGKTITGFSIVGLLPYNIMSHPTGSITFYKNGFKNQLLNKKEEYLRHFRGIDIGIIFQEPLSALNPLHTVSQQVSESLLLHKLCSRKAATEKVVDLLEQVELKNASQYLKAYPHQLSGGQRQRVMIAQALACSPSILIADEPTTALDVTIQEGIIELLKKLNKKHNMATLLISHDFGMVKKLADAICVMKNGSIVESGDCKTLLSRPTHDYTKKLIFAEPKRDLKPFANTNQEILNVKDLSIQYSKKHFFSFLNKEKTFAVKNASLSLKSGETLGIVGESGSGKTSLVLGIFRLLQSDGKIVFLSKNVHELSKKELRFSRKDMQVVFQDPFGALNPRLMVRDIIEEGLLLHYSDISDEERSNRVLQVLKDVHLDEDVLDRYPHEFSGGQRQRISIARAIILKPTMLALDEPTSALDRSIQKEVLDVLKQLQEKYNLSYLFISHDLAVIYALSHRIAIMKNGEIVEQGDTVSVVDNPQHDYTKKLFKAAFG